MEITGDSDHYILQTIANSDEQNLILASDTIIICSENGEQVQYAPYCMENGQILLKKFSETKRLESESSDKQIVKNNKQNVKKIYDKTQQKRKLSYETEFQPCSLPANRGGMKNLIRYGRKHLIIDQQIMISPREFKAQLSDSNDIVMMPDLAPCTKQQMRHVLSGTFIYIRNNC